MEEFAMKKTENKSSERYAAALEIMSDDNPNSAEAMRLLEQAKDEGDFRASYALGTWYLHGKQDVVAVDVEKGLRLISEAANMNIPDALYDLAVAAETGEGRVRNERLALSLYLKAALRGEPQSLYEVGRCYYYGIGTSLDKDVAQVWFERAAELGITDHQKINS